MLWAESGTAAVSQSVEAAAFIVTGAVVVLIAICCSAASCSESYYVSRLRGLASELGRRRGWKWLRFIANDQTEDGDAWDANDDDQNYHAREGSGLLSAHRQWSDEAAARSVVSVMQLQVHSAMRLRCDCHGTIVWLCSGSSRYARSCWCCA